MKHAGCVYCQVSFTAGNFYLKIHSNKIFKNLENRLSHTNGVCLMEIQKLFLLILYSYYEL